MKYSVLSASLLLASPLLGLSQHVPSGDNIGFVFELVRHGARAPLLDDGDYFSIPMGNLTE